MDDLVRSIRAFNRLYLPAMHLLGNHYLGSEYPVTEARVFFEIYEHRGCNAAHITRAMNIDKSYLSRIITKHEKKGYIRREESESDGRSLALYLTEAGIRRTEEFIHKSDMEIGDIIAPLTEEERAEFSRALRTIYGLLESIQSRRENELR